MEAQQTKKNLIYESGNPHWCLCYMRDHPTEDNTALFGCIVKRGTSFIALEELRAMEKAKRPVNYEALKLINKAQNKIKDNRRSK
jgi:hypothetical protein